MSLIPRSHNIMYWCYYVLGGFYFSEAPSIRIRYVWYTLTCLSLIVIYVFGTVGYLITTFKPKIPDIAFTLLIVSVGNYIFLTIPLITYAHRRDIETVMKFITDNASHDDFKILYTPHENYRSIDVVIDNEFRRSESFETFDLRKINSTRTSITWMVLGCIFGVVFILISPVNVLLIGEKDSYRNLQQHLIPVPFAENLPSLSLYLTLYCVETFCTGMIIYIGASLPTLVVLINVELYNIAVDCCARMQHVSRTIQLLTETKLLTSSDLSRSTKSESVFPSLFRYQRETTLFLKQCRVIMQMFKLFEPFQNIFSTLLLLAIFFCQFFSIYILFVTDLEIIFKIKHLMSPLTAAMYLYVNCSMGDLLSVVNEETRNAIYDTPWYHLPPVLRTHIHLLQCEIQRTRVLKAFKIFPVNKTMIPKVTKAMYTYINIVLRVNTYKL